MAHAAEAAAGGQHPAVGHIVHLPAAHALVYPGGQRAAGKAGILPVLRHHRLHGRLVDFKAGLLQRRAGKVGHLHADHVFPGGGKGHGQVAAVEDVTPAAYGPAGSQHLQAVRPGCHPDALGGAVHDVFLLGHPISVGKAHTDSSLACCFSVHGNPRRRGQAAADAAQVHLHRFSVMASGGFTLMPAPAHPGSSHVDHMEYTVPLGNPARGRCPPDSWSGHCPDALAAPISREGDGASDVLRVQQCRLYFPPYERFCQEGRREMVEFFPLYKTKGPPDGLRRAEKGIVLNYTLKFTDLSPWSFLPNT